MCSQLLLGQNWKSKTVLKSSEKADFKTDLPFWIWWKFAIATEKFQAKVVNIHFTTDNLQYATEKVQRQKSFFPLVPFGFSLCIVHCSVLISMLIHVLIFITISNLAVKNWIYSYHVYWDSISVVKMNHSNAYSSAKMHHLMWICNMHH